MDILELNPDVLDAVANIVEGYCSKQKSIMDTYLGNTAALSAEWTDDQTLGTMLEEIKHLKSNVEAVMDEIRATYPAYFRDRANYIRSRPKM